jgi:uncharacterized membrane protein
LSETFRQDFRRFFVRGLGAVLPVILTVALLAWLISKVQAYIGTPLNVAIQWVLVQIRTIGGDKWNWAGSEAAWAEVQRIWENYHLWWIGLLLALVAIYIFGRLLAAKLGRSLWRMIEHAFFRMPIIRQIYPYVKQVVDFLLSERKFDLQRVVAVEYPRKGIWSLGLVTGPGMRELHNHLSSDLLTIFIPSSPTPVTGYTITVNRHEVIDLPISIDDALRYSVSAGVIMPIGQQLSEAEIEQARQGLLTAGADYRKETQS